jgi:hypothetical protein
MKNCTKHFLERWTERIVGVTTEKERNDYIVNNRQMISDHANKTFEYAEFIYTGQIGDNLVRNYYIEDDIIYVTNTTNDAFITVYKVDLGFTPELNITVRKGLIDEIKKLTSEKEDIELQVLMEIDDKKHKAEIISEEIKLMEMQVANLRKQKAFVDEEVKNLNSKSLNTGLELKRYTMMLVNSKEYKEDLRSTK